VAALLLVASVSDAAVSVTFPRDDLA